jgi:hypothetical protein
MQKNVHHPCELLKLYVLNIPINARQWQFVCVYNQNQKIYMQGNFSNMLLLYPLMKNIFLNFFIKV